MDKSSQILQSTSGKRPRLHELEKSTPSVRKNSEIYWQDGKPLERSLLHMYENKLWTDVSFRCKGNVVENTADRILAHKNILAARSPVFEAMLFGQLAKDEIELENIEADIFDLVLRFVYSDETTLTNKNAVSVLEVAHMYQLTALVAYCTTYLHSMLQPDNACDILGIALHYDLETFVSKVQLFIDDNAAEVLKSDGFISVSQQCLTRILKSDTFYVNEKNILERTMQWADRKCAEEKLEVTGENKRRVLGDAFFQIRMTTLQAKDFLQFTRRNNYYTKDESEDICSKIAGEREVVISCHNPVHRIPRICEIQVPDKAIKKFSSYVKEIDCIVEAKVSRQIYIQGCTLKNVMPYKKNPDLLDILVFPGDESLEHMERYREPFDEELPLNAALLVEDESIMFIEMSSKSTNISFKEEFCLNPREKPYIIVFTLKYLGENDIAFRTLQSRYGEIVAMTNKDSNNIQESGIADIQFKYSDGSKHVNCIESFHVTNVSK